jgi:hypothetical protein
MKLCSCPGPLRSTSELERLRCLRCQGWSPHGRLVSVDRAAIQTGEVISLATKISEDFGWVHSLAHDPGRRGHSNGRVADVSDPTGQAATNKQRLVVAAYAAIASRLVERALGALRNADEAIGDALLAAELPGPVDHTPAPFHDPASLFPGRPDLADAHAARARRRARGEGTPT